LGVIYSLWLCLLRQSLFHLTRWFVGIMSQNFFGLQLFLIEFGQLWDRASFLSKYSQKCDSVFINLWGTFRK
jgi:hypothetical protein